MRSEGEYLHAFFEFMNARGVKYTVMNNYHGYPDVIEGDVDIALGQPDFERIDALVLEFSKEQQIPVIQRIPHGFRKCAYILSPTEPDRWFRLQLDFFCDFTAKGYFRLIRSEVMISSAQPCSNFKIPLPCVEAPFLMMRRIIKGDVTQQKWAEIKAAAAREPAIDAQVASRLGAQIASLLHEYCNADDIDTLRRKNDAYRRLLRTFSVRSSPLSYRSRYVMGNLVRLLHRAQHPVGLSIAVLGSDGSGKSTLIKSLPARAGGAFHGYTYRYWCPGLLPRMGRLKFWQPYREMTDNPDPHGRPPLGRLRSYGKLAYYFLDFAAGYFLCVLPRVAKKDLFVFDRYFYDFWIDPKRHRTAASPWVTRLLSRIVPSPDLVLVLDVSPEVALQRKQEVSREELELQRQRLMQLASLNPKAVVIDANRDAESVLRTATTAILKTCEARTARLLAA